MQVAESIGVGGGVRTLGHWNHNPALYQLSYTHRGPERLQSTTNELASRPASINDHPAPVTNRTSLNPGRSTPEHLEACGIMVSEGRLLSQFPVRPIFDNRIANPGRLPAQPKGQPRSVTHRCLKSALDASRAPFCRYGINKLDAQTRHPTTRARCVTPARPGYAQSSGHCPRLPPATGRSRTFRCSP